MVKSDGLEIRLTRDGAIRGSEWQVFLFLSLLTHCVNEHCQMLWIIAFLFELFSFNFKALRT